MKQVTSPKALVVDDEDAICQLLSLVLTEAGFEVGCARSGEEGLAQFSEKAWDVVITDGVMPGINGLEMARLMKEKNPLVPIILLSGMPDRFADPTVFETTFQKPFSTPDVLSSIEQAVAGPSRCSSGTSKPKDHQVPGQQSRSAQNHSGPASDCRLAWASESNSRVVPQAAHFGEMLTY